MSEISFSESHINIVCNMNCFFVQFFLGFVKLTCKIAKTADDKITSAKFQKISNTVLKIKDYSPHAIIWKLPFAYNLALKHLQ